VKNRVKVMVLDGDYGHSVAVHAELKKHLEVTTISVASSRTAPGHRSRYTDVRLLSCRPDEPAFGENLLSLVASAEPDLVVPVGYASSAHTVSVMDRLAPLTHALVPSASAFMTASSKPLTYEAARRVGIRVPEERQLGANGGVGERAPEDYPVFAKARLERGGVSTALIRSEKEFEQFDPESLGGDVMFQEYIDGSVFTYGHNGFYEHGHPVMTFQHEEVRSVPRRGGSGTRVRLADLPELARMADRLLLELDWSGIAQVEFKIAANGEFVLMEVNPKVWASYALARWSGHPIIATATCRALGIDLTHPARTRSAGASMVFPIREFAYVRKHRGTDGESLAASALAMLWPPARIDVELLDVCARWPRSSRRSGIEGTWGG